MRASSPRRLQARGGEDDGVVVAGVELGEPRVHVAAQRARAAGRGRARRSWHSRRRLEVPTRAPAGSAPSDSKRLETNASCGILARARTWRARTAAAGPSARPSSNAPRCRRGPRRGRSPAPSRTGPCRPPARAAGRARGRPWSSCGRARRRVAGSAPRSAAATMLVWREREAALARGDADALRQVASWGNERYHRFRLIAALR